MLRYFHTEPIRSRGPRAWLCTICLFATIAPGADSALADVSACFGGPGVGLCPAGTSPCVVDDPVTVLPGTILDCGSADLVVANDLGRLTVTGGLMTIRAHNLTIENGRDLIATGYASSSAGIVIELTGSLHSWGRLTAPNFGAGSYVSITAALDIVLEQSGAGVVGIDMVGDGQGDDGGDLVLRAGRDVYLGRSVLLNGNDSTGSANKNSGGDATVVAAGDVHIDQLIRAFGRWFGGGTLSIQAGGDVELNHDGPSGMRKGEIDLQSKGDDGDGGNLDIEAGNLVLLSGPVELGSGIGHNGGNDRGGDLSIKSGCGGVRLEDTIDLTGGDGGGGNLEISSQGGVVSAGSIDASARKAEGNGGDVILRSLMGNVVLEGTTAIHASGNLGTQGVAGTIGLFGCQVDVLNGAAVEAAGQSHGRFEVSSYKQGAALQGSFGVRISEFADISSYSSSGKIVLRTPTVTSGLCDNSPATPCQYDSDCAVGCSTGNCVGGNPQTDGQVVQFSSLPVVEQDASLGPCPATCQ